MSGYDVGRQGGFAEGVQRSEKPQSRQRKVGLVLSHFAQIPCARHMAYRLDSGGQSLLIAADFANHYVWSLAHPDWEVKFDMDTACLTMCRIAISCSLADRWARLF